MSQTKSRYAYDPSLATAIVAAALYTLAFALTFILWLTYKAWVWAVMVVAAAMESIGYIVRCLSTQKPDDKVLYVLSFALIILAPVLMAAACYIVFGRIVYHVVPSEARTTRLLWVSARWLTPIFVLCDIVALLLQMVGAIKITSINPGDSDAASKAHKGKNIAEIGVAVQLVCFGLFSIIAVRFSFTSKRFIRSFNEAHVDGTGAREGKYFVMREGSRERKLDRNWQAIIARYESDFCFDLGMLTGSGISRFDRCIGWLILRLGEVDIRRRMSGDAKKACTSSMRWSSFPCLPALLYGIQRGIFRNSDSVFLKLLAS
ncbi:Protoporphyrin uptake protein, partial [Lachnellula occidentalis]